MNAPEYAFDLGTTNSVVAKWNDRSDVVELLEFPGVSRGLTDGSLIRNQHAVPSAVYVGERRGFIFKKRSYLIGLEALEKETYSSYSRVIRNFKPALMRNGSQLLLRHAGEPFTARDAARIFLSRICGLIRARDGKPPRSMTFSVPVDSYEPYRAHLKHAARTLGIKRFRLVDEPVAAAVGYGLRMDEPRNVLVFDFGGGTLDLALVRFGDKNTESGRCSVIAKEAVPLGGNAIDRWLVDFFCERTGYSFDCNDVTGGLVWNSLLLEEARRIKENLMLKEPQTFFLVPPKEYQSFDVRVFTEQKNLDRPLDISRAQLMEMLSRRGLFAVIDSVLDGLLESARQNGVGKKDVDSVLLVGGSSLLPGIYAHFEKAFGRSRIQSWQPFNAVAYGACIFGADRMTTSDFITHEYAFVTHDPQTLKPVYNIIVPRNTPFPTAKGFWKRRVTPTCSRGVPEKIYKLLICEIGRKRTNYQEFVFDKKGRLSELDGDGSRLIVPLNEDDPVLGTLNPPHMPGDGSARLEVSFMVNADKWLCATVFDLRTGSLLLDGEPVVRLR